MPPNPHSVNGLPKRCQAHGFRGYVGVSANRGPSYSTLNSRMISIRTPNFRKLPYIAWGSETLITRSLTALKALLLSTLKQLQAKRGVQKKH